MCAAVYLFFGEACTVYIIQNIVAQLILVAIIECYTPILTFPLSGGLKYPLPAFRVVLVWIPMSFGRGRKYYSPVWINNNEKIQRAAHPPNLPYAGNG